MTVVDLVNNRVVPNAMEPRGCLGEFDEASGRYTLRTGGQGVHSMQGVLAEMMGLEPQRIRVIQADVGGGFGMKIWVYPEYPVCLLAARLTGRPVKWVSDRSEGFVSDTHGRDHVTRVQIALDAEGRMLALRASITANLGAYLSQFGPFIPTDAGAKMYNGVYAFQAVHVECRGAYTNTVPVDAYRGAGRPEAAYAVERAVDAAARDLGTDPAEFRRRNFIRPEQMPFRTAMATTYDSGEFARLMDAALDQAEATGFPQRRAAARAKGKLRGLGVAYYIEQCSGGPDENARIEVLPEGRVRLYIGTQSNGQGHATAYAQLISDVFGIEPGLVDTIQGDTDLVATGRGTGGSRSVPVGGVAAQRAGEAAAEGGASSPARCWRRRRPTSSWSTAATACSAPTAAWACSRSRPRPAGAGSRARATSSPRSTPSRTAATSASSRSTPPPACRDRPLHHRRRLRRGAEPADARRPGARRRGAGHRPGAARGGGLRRDRAAR